MLTALSPTAGFVVNIICGTGLKPYQIRSDGDGGILTVKQPLILETFTIRRISVLESPSMARLTYESSAA